ncbi:glycosyltransferase family 9 protein [Nocardia pseudobrasiliensis]|uniref:ADP-heptose:LPS heptosyltransferase n=1 Tax=Nocardia pseudobrasiliensis TaxID=45979 RepID=A0A370IAN6_9NOCA|nr:glycosyltransferase family 9 protein [Nocardia pseudobrasiliensis]RDI67782.1 ADP-heptose:LPS heptosyltransferase [Nocardia pseudobrasiliensis]
MGSIGSVGEVWPEVRRIVVVRGGGLAELLLVMPAIEALAVAYPSARIVLLGSRVHVELLEGRPGPIDEVIALPPGSTEVSGSADAEVEAEFFRRICCAPVDLGVQLHDDGRWSNGFLHQLHPHWSVGSHVLDAAPLTRTLPFRPRQHETLRALEIVGLAGARPTGLHPRVAIVDADRAAAAELLADMPTPLIALGPGAGDGWRRWPVDRFAEVAAHCLRRGFGVVALGAERDRELLARLRTRVDELDAGAELKVLAGAGLPAVCGVLARSGVLIGNAGGLRELAAAVGTPTIGVFWIGTALVAGPLGRGRDRVLLSWNTNCPVCGQDWTDERGAPCAHEVSLVDGVRVEQVLAAVDALLSDRYEL